MQTPKGRKILVDNSLKIIDKGITTISEVEYATAAQKHFGLEKGGRL